jgi:hypothetical protein
MKRRLEIVRVLVLLGNIGHVVVLHVVVVMSGLTEKEKRESLCGVTSPETVVVAMVVSAVNAEIQSVLAH